MLNVLVIFDDTNAKSEIIRDVIGEKGFADVVVKKKRLENYYMEGIQKLYPKAKWQTIRSVFEFNEFVKNAETVFSENTRVLHCFSNYIISDEKNVLLSYEKLRFIDEDYKIMSDGKAAAVMFHNLPSYLRYLNVICSGQNSMEAVKGIENFWEMGGLVDIGRIGNFIQCITGNFDSRFFNSLQGNEYTLVKSSTNKKKIKSEYTYYHLLPDDMKFWYVMPFQYQESEKTASYTMERLHMTDLAIKWVHGSIGISEFEELLDKYFYFFQCRHKKEVSKEEYDRTARSLYVDKVVDRINDLKKLPEYRKIAKLMEAGCEEQTVDVLAEKYFELKEKIERKNHFPQVSVIGHGDPCFANALYNKSTKTLKFIDPKGALTEEELWTNPYYDIAKLSHSVCGRYDFFNNALFEIRINEQFECELHIEFDNSEYKKIFKKKLEENGYDYLTVRLYEASLFLSMLPLHIDYPHKVFGFILNVRNILKEIERDVS